MLLDPESEQVRDVYAYYGLAMYWAQCLEQAIFQHLIFFDHFPKAVANYTTPANWAEDFDRYQERELGQTMGKLMHRLREVGQPTDAVELLLNDTLKSRNWLAHGFFPDRAVPFTLPNGRKDMIAELEVLQERFRLCTQELDAVSLPAARKLGLTDEIIAKIQLDMTAAYVQRSSEI